MKKNYLNENNIKITSFFTPFGEGLIIYSPKIKKIKRIILPNLWKNIALSSNKEPNYIISLKEKLQAYFVGKYKKNFINFQLDIKSYPKIYRVIWNILINSVNYGEVRSYSWVAEKLAEFSKFSKLSKLQRLFLTLAALRANPFPIVIPCHRIIKKDGNRGSKTSIGGYTPGGKIWKLRLLELELNSLKK